MTDLREKQPDRREVDLSRDTFGNYAWSAHIEVYPYSSIKNEDVYSRNVILIFRADDSRRAHGFAQSILSILSLVHDVHYTNLRSLTRL